MRFRLNRTGYNLLELTVGVIIFALAVIPLFWFFLSTSRTTHNYGNRLQAAQVGQDILEYLLNKPYEACVAEAQAYSGDRHWVIADQEFRRMCTEAEPPELRERLIRQFQISDRHIQYEVQVKEDPAAQNGRIAMISVIVTYRADDLDSESASLRLNISGLKFDRDL
jgi:hypothetical protein